MRKKPPTASDRGSGLDPADTAAEPAESPWVAIEQLRAELEAETRKLERERTQLELERSMDLHVDVRTRDKGEDRSSKERLVRQVAESARMLALLCDVTAAANRAESIEELLRYALVRVCKHNEWSFGHAYLLSVLDPNKLMPVLIHYDEEAEFRKFRNISAKELVNKGEGLPGRVLATGRSEWTTDVAGRLNQKRREVPEATRIRSAAAFPIRVSEEIVGVMEFFAEKTIEPSDIMLRSMVSIGTQIGLVIERKRLETDLARAAVEEQRRIGQDLHDSVGQELAGLALSAERTGRHLRQQGLPEAEDLYELASGVRTALEHIRGTVRNLATAVSGPGTLPDALADLAASVETRSDVNCTVSADISVELQEPVTAVQLYRIASEAVANALRHGKARNIKIHLASNPDGVILQVEDDGSGISNEAAMHSGGVGLKIMKQRARVIGGDFKIKSADSGGTIVTCTISS